MNGYWLTFSNWLYEATWDWFAYSVITGIKIAAIILPLILTVAYLTYAERKIIGYMQIRIGPNRVGPKGWFQPFADVLKLLFKEIILPARANKWLFLAAPILTLAPVLAVWAVIPFDVALVVADVNAGLLYVLAITAVGVYGVLLAGWASNSKYPLLSTLRAASAMISYEIAMGFALVAVVMAAGSLRLTDIVLAQQGSIFHWFWLPLLPLVVVYFVAGMVETNRTPFCVIEGESEIVGGTHVEYSGMAYALFFLAEYAHMILISMLTVLMFFGGWLSPFAGIPYLTSFGEMVPGVVWLLLKTAVFLYILLWARATFPRYRYDQIMRLGWQVFIPLTIVWIVFIAALVLLQLPPWFN